MMSTGNKPSADRLRSELDELVDRFEAAWRQGQPPAIDDYLPLGEGSRHAVLVELVYVDLERRLARDEAVQVEQYLAKFPELAQDRAIVLDLIATEYRLRKRRDPGLTLATFVERFPQYRDELPRHQAGPPHPRRRFPIHLNCPHCHSPIEIVTGSPDEEILCPSCGSSFRVDPDHTQTWSKDRLPQLGKFELIEAVGRGAFGTVYRARDVQLQRIVAVKVPRSGRLATDEDEDRFLREARNAAQLQHAGIVPVYEVGRSGTFPYIVSEFVEGITLSDALTARRFGFRESAKLVAQVAAALEHAHTQGVVHRDLKPSNIMLTADGSPRVMDFGLAKRDAGEVTMTVEGQVLGTPAYMSPEQASGQAHHVDGRSDVYSLGGILYELLTGELPFRGNQRMILHQVLHDEPRSLHSLNDRIPRDLETICLKAMAKEPFRRYETAQSMADDLTRYLAGQPIAARPVGRVERSWRWCRRNRVVAGLTTAVVLALVVGTVGSSYFAIEAQSRAREATRERQRAEEGFREARRASEMAAARAATANSVSQFLIGMFEEPTPFEFFTLRLGSGNVSAASRALLDRGAQQLTERLDDQPALKASLMAAIGRAHFGTGNLAKAIELFEQALEIRRRELPADNPQIAESMQELGTVYFLQGRIGQAETLLRENIDVRRAVYASSDERVVAAVGQLALLLGLTARNIPESERLWREVIAARRRSLDPKDPRLGEALMSLGGVLLWSFGPTTAETLRRDAEALRLISEGLEILKARDATRDMGLVIATYQRAILLVAIGNTNGAVAAVAEAHERAKIALGDEHPLTAFMMAEHASLLIRANKRQEARAVYDAVFLMFQTRGMMFQFSNRESMRVTEYQSLLDESGEKEQFEAILRRVWSKQMEQTKGQSCTGLSVLLKLATLFIDRHQAREAASLIDDYLTASRVLDVSSNTLSARQLYDLAKVLAALGKAEAATMALDKSVARLPFEFSEQPIKKIDGLNAVADSFSTLGVFDRAEMRIRESLAMQQSAPVHDEPGLTETLSKLAQVIDQQHRPLEADECFGEAIERSHKLAAGDKKHLGLHLRVATKWADALSARSDVANSERVLRDAIDVGNRIDGANGKNNSAMLAAMLRLGRIQVKQGKTDQARSFFEQIVAATASPDEKDERAPIAKDARDELARLTDNPVDTSKTQPADP